MKLEGRAAFRVGAVSCVLVGLTWSAFPTMPYASSTIDKAQFLQLFCQSVQLKPDATGKSSYTDVPVTSPYWGYVHRAIELGLVKADSAKLFGASDSVSTAFAAQIVTKYENMALGGLTPTQWAERQGLVTASTAPWTPEQAQQFLAGLKSLAASHKALPGSWMLTTPQVSEFTKALAALDQASFYQISSVMTDGFSYQLTAAGKKNTKIANALQKQANDSKSELDAARSVGVVGGTSVSVNQSMLTSVNAKTGAKSTQTIQDVSFGNTLYTKQGNATQWSSKTAQVNNTVEFIPMFGSGSFTNITIAQGTGRDVFTANLTPAAQNGFFASYLSGLAGVHANGSANLISTMEKGMTSTVKIYVNTSGRTPTVTEEDLTTNIKMTPTTFAQLAGEGSQAKTIATYVSNVTVSISAKAQISYNQTVPVLPSGLSIAGWSSGDGAPTNATGASANGTGTNSANSIDASGNGAAGGSNTLDIGTNLFN
ncbi:S-layer homology domain-containing protein [Alicyclobacillus acidiphilus]|uniref:S-layer homology domain-containing protein n=1 Tax=Alicyclobacillus acidiphilus TaxID=182455 RepID=UPI000835BDB0|nr:S-layer homology domain-containing protein [Alicyclobacillus acidiphilus]